MMRDDPTNQRSPAAPRRRLLVVDRTAESRTALAQYFGAHGWEVVTASDSSAALSQGVSAGISAIIMDASLPGVPGYEVAALLRRLRPDVPVVLTLEPTAQPEPTRTRRRDRFACYAKPLDLDALARALEPPAAPADAGTGGSP
jgi:CheY-like chemotaxis protein